MIPEIKKILYATDLSENARYAFSYATSLANRYGAGITILHVLQDLSPYRDSLVVNVLGEERWSELRK
ncbi:MAG: universal stress protein, partial [Deltaproteobacteria bacterium]|nr:universal stress protein [Deltaproteobacteria bacterium]